MAFHAGLSVMKTSPALPGIGSRNLTKTRFDNKWICGTIEIRITEYNVIESIFSDMIQ